MSNIQQCDEKQAIEPIQHVFRKSNITDDNTSQWTLKGYEELAKGRACALLLAGGQGTRLGTSDPKGMYDIGLPSRKSLYWIQAEKILRLKELVKEKMGVDNVSIPWYIMTSFATDKKTISYFEANNYFGLDKSEIFFFNQDLFPCVSLDGEILLSSKSEIAVAPNGNGGIWSALERNGVLADMERRGIRWICSYPVDNILVKICDPLFIGFCADNDVEIGCKVVPKLNPTERVGVLALRNGKPVVIEYSEISNEDAHACHPETGHLLYNSSHIVLNTFSIEFVKRIVKETLTKLPYHFAKKAIPSLDEKGENVSIEGYKFELFVFDVFEFVQPNKFFALEIDRDEEFAPLKNDDDSPVDNPTTCRQMVSCLHKKYIESAGGKFENHEGVCEISPLISYSGEGLEFVHAKTYKLPLHLTRRE